jgi:bacterioferritin (cytochrome b1)
MLLTREEMTFDFGGARLDPKRDRALLGWMMNQFLYGEVTGIQCGHWLYDAPDLEAARFFSRQAVEEFQHVDNFLRILSLLGETPAPAHGMVRFLTSGMMPSTFEEHVCLEMALGEGFVLMALYSVIDTIEHDDIRNILMRAVKQEERHVEFGERRTSAAVARDPSLRRRLLGLSLVSTWGVKRLGAFLKSRVPADHPVLARLPAFLKFSVECAQARLLRMGVLTKPFAELSSLTKAAAIGEAYGVQLASFPVRKLRPRRRLTETYLRDPLVLGFNGTGTSEGAGEKKAEEPEPLRLVRQ